MNIALAIYELTTHPPTTTASLSRGKGFAFWILLAGVLSGLASLTLAAFASTQP
jgi:hypothetical protein